MSLDLFFDVPKKEEKKEPVSQTKGYMDLIKKDTEVIRDKIRARDDDDKDTYNETYIFLGMYLDFGYFKDEEKQAEILKILQHRWSNQINIDAFRRYFDDHKVTEKDFNLV